MPVTNEDFAIVINEQIQQCCATHWRVVKNCRDVTKIYDVAYLHSWIDIIGSSLDVGIQTDTLPLDTIISYPVHAPFSRLPDMTSQYVPSAIPI